jgi:multiple sugar transport system substrate-binding protein
MMSILISILKRFFMRFLLIVILVLTLGRMVDSAQPSNNTPITIRTLMSAPDALIMRSLVAEFNEKNPDINLEIVEGPNATNQVEDLYSSSFLLGNSPYDLVFMDSIWVPKFAAARWLSPLSDKIPSAELSQFLQGDVNGGIYQQKLYRIPFNSNAGMLYYRKDLLEQTGHSPPETFEDLIQISKDLQQQGLIDWGFLWQGKQYEGLSAVFVEVLQGFGGFWVNPNTLEIGLEQKEAIAAVKFLKQTIKEKISPPGVVTYQEEETRRFFQNGKAAFLRNWPYVFRLASLDDSFIKGKFGIKPMVHSPNFSSGACQGGWGFGIAKNTQHLDEAWRAIAFLTSEETQKKMTLRTGYIPSRKSLFNDPEVVAAYSYYPDLLKILETSALRPPIAQYAQASDILQRYLSAAITEKMSPEEAMQAAAKETKNLLRI